MKLKEAVKHRLKDKKKELIRIELINDRELEPAEKRKIIELKAAIEELNTVMDIIG